VLCVRAGCVHSKSHMPNICSKLVLLSCSQTRGKILCAILNKYYSFTQPFGSDWTFWYIRESSTAIIVGNLPLTWPLIRSIFNVRSFNGDSTNKHSRTTTAHFRSGGLRHVTEVTTRDTDDISILDPSESEERMKKSYSASVPLKIYRHDEFQVDSQPFPLDSDDPSEGLSCTVKATSSSAITGDRQVADHSSGIFGRDAYCHV
jgi:hypothetical protein